MFFRKHLCFLLSFLLVVLFLVGCSGGHALVGEWSGSQGSYLKFDKNGTCFYADDDDIGRGTWYIEEDTLYVNVDCFGYMLYADLSDLEFGFVLEGESYYWNDELFRKID